MIVFRVGDVKTVIEGADRDTMRALDARTSYRVKGSEFSPSFRNRQWDGKIHLLRYSARYGLRLYTGLVPVAARLLRNRGQAVEIVDERRPADRVLDAPLPWLDDTMEERDYQEDAVAALTDDSRVLPGRGMLKAAVRSGKTVVIGKTIRRLGVRSIFLVHRERLLKQTAALYRRLFGDDRVGVVGDGLFEPADVTVASVPTLHARRKTKEVRRLLKSVDAVFADECHHLKDAATWKSVMTSSDARYKFGMSATIYLKAKRPSERGAIWLQALTGPLLYTVSTRTLTERGVLLKATVHVVPVHGPVVAGTDWHEAERDGIALHEHRNRLAALIARVHAVDKDRKVLLIGRRHDHLEALMDALADEGVGHLAARVDGRTAGAARDEAVARFVSGERPILVGNVFGEGVDIPAIQTVINCEGGRDRKNTVQRLRNLTPDEGKKDGVDVFDFADLHNRVLAAHSRHRLAAYKAERCFDFRVLDFSKGATP